MPSWTRCALLPVLAALVAAPVASAATVYPSVSPPALRGQGPWDVTYQVELDSGPVAEHVAVDVSSTWGIPPDPVLAGPGTLTRGNVQAVAADRFCAGGSLSFATVSGTTEWLIDLPANTVNVLSLTTRVSHRFAVSSTRLSDVSFTVDGVPVDLPGPDIVARRDAGITLNAGSGKLMTSVAAGGRVILRGQSSPLLAGQRIDIRAAFGTATRMTIPVARVRIRADGSFAASWRPPKAGRWMLGAFYHSQDPRFLDSTSMNCFPIVQAG